MLYNFAFIITDGVFFIDGEGNATPKRESAHRYPYHGEARTAARKFGGKWRVREVD